MGYFSLLTFAPVSNQPYCLLYMFSIIPTLTVWVDIRTTLEYLVWTGGELTHLLILPKQLNTFFSHIHVNCPDVWKASTASWLYTDSGSKLGNTLFLNLHYVSLLTISPWITPLENSGIIKPENRFDKSNSGTLNPQKVIVNYVPFELNQLYGHSRFFHPSTLFQIMEIFLQL